MDMFGKSKPIVMQDERGRISVMEQLLIGFAAIRISRFSHALASLPMTKGLQRIVQSVALRESVIQSTEGCGSRDQR